MTPVYHEWIDTSNDDHIVICHMEGTKGSIGVIHYSNSNYLR